jgi:hypothetical protein
MTRALWFVHDGTVARYAFVVVSELLDKIFGVRWIGRREPTKWRTGSPDLNLCDCCIWGEPENLIVLSDCHHREGAAAWSQTDRAKVEHSECVVQSLIRLACSISSYTSDHILEQ